MSAKVEIVLNYFLCLVHHLRFGNPQRRLCDRHGKIVYLNAVELVYRDLNGVLQGFPYYHLAVHLFLITVKDRPYDLIFYSSYRNVRFS